MLLECMAMREREAERGNMKARSTPPHTSTATSTMDMYTQLEQCRERGSNTHAAQSFAV